VDNDVGTLGHIQVVTASIGSPSARWFDLGPLHIHYYALCIIVGVVAAVWLTYRRWTAQGGDPDLVFEVALWSIIAGLIGGRLYFDLTTPDQMGHQWYAPLAIWQGGLGIWGAVLFGVLAGAVVVRRRGASVRAFLDAAAPGLPLAQGIGRLGNWFNQELFGGPTTLPWGLRIDPPFRPAHYANFTTFQPTFLYEMVWDLGLAGLLTWLGHRYRIRAPGLFCLYVCLYCVIRSVLELMRVDPATILLGERLNFWVAVIGVIGGGAAFVYLQWRRPEQTSPGAVSEA
jgi:prolipoprotein diacylglyceryl transferase